MANDAGRRLSNNRGPILQNIVRYRPGLFAISHVSTVGQTVGQHMRERLTAKQVENAKPGRYGDGGGLWLEVSASATRHWTLRYQINGRARWMGLGSAEVVTLADARERARVARLALVDGIDPLEARRAQRAERRRAQAATITFREAAILPSQPSSRRLRIRRSRSA